MGRPGLIRSPRHNATLTKYRRPLCDRTPFAGAGSPESVMPRGQIPAHMRNYHSRFTLAALRAAISGTALVIQSKSNLIRAHQQHALYIRGLAGSLMSHTLKFLGFLHPDAVHAAGGRGRNCTAVFRFSLQRFSTIFLLSVRSTCRFCR